MSLRNVTRIVFFRFFDVLEVAFEVIFLYLLRCLRAQVQTLRLALRGLLGLRQVASMVRRAALGVADLHGSHFEERRLVPLELF